MMVRIFRQRFGALMIVAMLLVMSSRTMPPGLAAAPVAPNENSVYVENFTTYTNKAYVDGSVWDVWAHNLKLSPNDGTNQSSPDVAMSTNHSFFAVWLDGRGGGYYVQRLDAEGNRLWAEDVRANIADLGSYNKSAPRIATGPDNNAYIVWADDRSGNWDVYAQRIDTNGNILWFSDVRVNETAAGNQSIPSVTVDTNNHAYIIWDDDQAGHNVYAQRIGLAGISQWAADVQVNQNPTNQTYSPYTLPAISANTSGVIAVSWLGYAQPGATNMTVYVQRISSSGSRVWGNDFEVGSSTPVGIANQQDMDVDSSGNIFVAWTDNDTSLFAHKLSSTGNFMWSAAQSIYTGPSQVFSVDVEADNLGGILCTFVKSGIDVYASWLDSSGALLWSSPFKVNYKTHSAYYWQAHTAMDSTNSAIVAWSNDMSYRMYAHDSFAQRLNRTGMREWDRDAVIHSRSGTTVGGYPLVARSGSNIFAAWRDSRNGCGDIYINRLDSAGQRLWQSDVRINSSCQGSTTSNRDFDLATYPDGSAIVVYTQWPTTVVAQAIDIYGNKLWVQPISITTNGTNPQVTVDSLNNAVVIWRDGYWPTTSDIYMQKFDRSGQTVWTSLGRVNATSDIVGNYYDQIRVDADTFGNVFVAWQDVRNNPGSGSRLSDVYVQKIDLNGNRQWGEDQKAHSGNLSGAPNLAIHADGSGGVYVSWSAEASGSYHAYIQKLASTGSRAWTNDLEVFDWSGYSYWSNYSDIEVVGGDAYIIFWSWNYQPLMQRVSTEGSLAWPGWIYAGMVTGSGKGASISSVNGNLLVSWGGNANGTTSIYAQLIDPSSNFLWGTDQRIAPGDFYFYPTGSAQSRNINQLAGALNQATLTSDLQANGGVVQFYLTNDGGADWFPVTPGVTHVFTTTGSDLRWRAELIADPLWPRTPVVSSIRIEYSTAIPYADDYELDDDCTQAKPIATGGAAQTHTFHQQADADWVWFDVITNTTYVAQATHTGLNANLELALYDTCQHVVQNGDPSLGNDVRLVLDGLPAGRYYLKVTNTDPNVFGADTGYTLSVRAEHPNGLAVIVAGRLKMNDVLQPNINTAANRAYLTFLQRGYSKQNIYYLNTQINQDVDDNGLSDDVDGTPSVVNVREAIQTWARQRGVALGVPLYVYLVDHGEVDRFHADLGQTVTAELLNLWLSNLEATTGADQITVILEACHSGSFVDQYQALGYGAAEIAGPNRVIVSSTSSWANAFPLGDGVLFSDAFWGAMREGRSVRASFQQGQAAVQSAGNVNCVYPNAFCQQPWLDDNGNGVPNESTDGQLAQARGLPATLGWDVPEVAAVTVNVPGAGGVGSILAEVYDNGALSTVEALIIPPGYQPVDPGDGSLPTWNVPTVTLTTAGSNLFAGQFDFTVRGFYRVVAYARDGQNNQSAPQAAMICVNCSNVYLPLLRK